MEHRIEITRNQYLQLQSMTFNGVRITVKTSITPIEILQYQEIDLYLKLIMLGVQVEQKLELEHYYGGGKLWGDYYLIWNTD